MHEIKPFVLGDALPQGVGVGLAHLIPTHMRHLEGAPGLGIAHFFRREQGYAPGQHIQTRGAAALLAEFIQGLQAQTNTEKRLGLHGLEQGLPQAALVEGSDATGYGPLSGKHDAIRAQ